MPEIFMRDESYAIMGACFEVYNVMGSGFVEQVYQESLEIEFTARNMKATKLKLRILVNYGAHPKLKYERIVC